MDTYKNFEDLKLNEPKLSYDIAYKNLKSRFLVFPLMPEGLNRELRKYACKLPGIYIHIISFPEMATNVKGFT